MMTNVEATTAQPLVRPSPSTSSSPKNNTRKRKMAHQSSFFSSTSSLSSRDFSSDSIRSLAGTDAASRSICDWEEAAAAAATCRRPGRRLMRPARHTPRSPHRGGDARRSSLALPSLAVAAALMVSSLCLSAVVRVAEGAAQKSTNPRHCGGSVRHVHLSVGDDPSTSMTVSFASISSAFVPAPIAGVRVGLSPDSLDDVFLEDSSPSSCFGGGCPSHYNVTVMHEKQANHPAGVDKTKYFSPYYHHVAVTGLDPSTVYYYQPIIHADLNAFYRHYDSVVLPAFQQQLRRTQDDSAPEDEDDDDLEMQGDDFDDEGDEDFDDQDDDIKTRQRTRRLERQRRRLIRWGPYDGTGKTCPSPYMIRSFRTGPASTQLKDQGLDKPLNFAIVGDLGQFPHSQDTMSSLLQSKEDLDLMVLAGDIAYTGLDQRKWDTFFDFLDDYPVNDQVPLQVVAGNHDIDKLTNGQDIFLAYEHRFRMPRVGPPLLGVYDGDELMEDGQMNMDHPPYPLPYEYGNAYYTFSYGIVKFIMLNSYSSMEPGSPQYRWLQEELEATDRETTPWLIAVLHAPLYNTFGLHQRDPQILAAKEHLEPLFVEHRVNFVISGHLHAYMRTENVVRDRPTPTGPVHLIVGAGGRKCEAAFRNEEPEEWVSVRDATVYGYATLRVHNSSWAEWDWIHTGVADDGRTYNQVHKQPDIHLPSSQGVRDHVFVENQYKL